MEMMVLWAAAVIYLIRSLLFQISMEHHRHLASTGGGCFPHNFSQPQTSGKSAFSSLVPLPAEVVQLCESAFGKLYHPYAALRWTILDQIRRVFYADCNGDVQHLCHSFLAPAANLLDTIRKACQVRKLSLSEHGIPVVRLCLSRIAH